MTSETLENLEKCARALAGWLVLAQKPFGVDPRAAIDAIREHHARALRIVRESKTLGLTVSEAIRIQEAVKAINVAQLNNRQANYDPSFEISMLMNIADSLRRKCN